MRLIREWCGLAAVALLITVVVGMGSRAEAAGARGDRADPDREFRPEWRELFHTDGSLLQPRIGGLDTVFLEDRISGGTVEDISALQHAADPANSIVRNGPVSAPHDLGNAYVLARVEGIDLVFDIRVERLAGGGGTESYVEIEFNRDLVSVSSGRRFPSDGKDGETLPGYELHYPFRGERTPGDLAVRVNLVDRMVSSVEFKRWENVDGHFDYLTLEAIENLADEACFGLSTFYSICSGSTVLADGSLSYIANGDPERSYTPDSYFEISLNVSRLVGPDPDFTTILVTSPEDFSFGTFKVFGRFAKPSSDVGSTPTRRNSR